MKTYSPLENQSLFDVCAMHFGTHEAIIGLAVANNVSITDRLSPNGAIALNESPIKTSVVHWYDKKQIVPATFYTGLENEALTEQNNWDEFPVNL